MSNILIKSVEQSFKKKIPRKLKIFLMPFFQKKDMFDQNIKKNDLKLIVALASDYGNLGDLAITEAQIRFLSNFDNYKIIKLPVSDTNRLLKKLKSITNEKDIITLIGGGNMGNVYSEFEECRKIVIEYFPDNKIISFPQTIDFTKNAEGEEALKKSIQVYSKHSNLHIFAREELSYSLMKKNFINNKVYLTPDIVLSMEQHLPKQRREHALICLRDDKENYLTIGDKVRIDNFINEKFKKVVYYDTHLGDVQITDDNAKNELEKIWLEFRKSRIVVTDRLHGMIFCAITKTPCIVFPNSNHKITESYNAWLKDLNYIKLVETLDQDELNVSTSELLNLKELDNVNFKEKFKPLYEILKNNVED